MEAEYLNIFQVFTRKLETWVNNFIEKTPNLLIAILIIVAGFYLARLINKIVSHLLIKRRIKPSARIMIGNITFIVMMFIFFMIALDVLDLDNVLKTILAGAGVAGLAIGLALQGTLSNTFSGITLSFTKDLRIGDQVETTGFTGIIEDIGLRKIKIKTPDGNYVSIPNKTIVDNPLKNYSETHLTVASLTCGVGYESDLEKVKDLTIQTLKDMMKEEAFNTSIVFFYTKFSESSIDFEVRFSIPSKTILESQQHKSDAIIAIKKAFDREKINIPFPIRTMDFSKGFGTKEV